MSVTNEGHVRGGRKTRGLPVPFSQPVNKVQFSITLNLPPHGRIDKERLRVFHLSLSLFVSLSWSITRVTRVVPTHDADERSEARTAAE